VRAHPRHLTQTLTQTLTRTLSLSLTLTPSLSLTRYEFTIVTHENQGYSIRCGTNAEYTQWTDAIKQIVAPPLSRGHAEEAVDGEVPGKKKSIFSRATSLGQGGKKKSVTE